jgi:four helix bundle protein
MANFRRLLVWEKAQVLAVATYRTASAMRRVTDLSLRNQMIRAANSIPANIAEGRRQSSEKDFARFLNFALNSAYELEQHILMAAAIDAIPRAKESFLIGATIEVRKMLYGLLRKLRERPPQSERKEKPKIENGEPGEVTSKGPDETRTDQTDQSDGDGSSSPKPDRRSR